MVLYEEGLGKGNEGRMLIWAKRLLSLVPALVDASMERMPTKMKRERRRVRRRKVSARILRGGGESPLLMESRLGMERGVGEGELRCSALVKCVSFRLAYVV